MLREPERERESQWRVAAPGMSNAWVRVLYPCALVLLLLKWRRLEIQRGHDHGVVLR
jgi:hypothetical protein